MAEPYTGEIRLFAGNFVPYGWARCDGSLLPIAQNTMLFSLLGTTYGGDGETDFALPDLRGRVALHAGTLGADTRELGRRSGAERVALIADQMPAHDHAVRASAAAGASGSPAGKVHAEGGAYGAVGNATLDAAATTMQGGGAPHDNMQPYLTATYIIALQGIYPPRP